MVVFEFIKFIFLGILIILVSKYILMFSIRNISLILQLKTSTTGKITGYATSAPELISSIFASYLGMINTVSYNIISSNIINVFLFILSLAIFKKIKYLKRKNFQLQYMLVVLSIIIPIYLSNNNLSSNLYIVPIFIVLFIIYLKYDKYFNKEQAEKIDKTKNTLLPKKIKISKRKISLNIFLLSISIILLYILGDNLGNCLDTLFSVFNIPEYVLGIIIGFITSLPEFTTFLSSQQYYIKNKSIGNSDLGIIETVNNLISSNISNLLIIQTIGIIIYNIF